MRRLETALVIGAVIAVPATAAAQQGAEVTRGANLYGQTCARCHNLRAPTERTDQEWVTIMSHMRARANLSRSDAVAILAFLQATNLPEGSRMAGAAVEQPETELAVRPNPSGTSEVVAQPIETIIGPVWLDFSPVRIRQLLRRVEILTMEGRAP